VAGGAGSLHGMLLHGGRSRLLLRREPIGEPTRSSAGQRRRDGPKQLFVPNSRTLSVQHARAAGPGADLIRPRLLACAVADKTAVIYKRALRNFDTWRESAPAGDVGVDLAAARYMSHMCFDLGQGSWRGGLLVSALVDRSPELKPALPLARRAWKAWQPLTLSGEREPTCREAVGAVISWLRSACPEAALIVAFAYATFARTSEWELLRVSDLSFAQGELGVEFGIQARGESTKTGPHLGAVVSQAWLIAAMRRHVRGKSRSSRVFTMTPFELRRFVSEACRELGLPPVVPHSLCRHTAATEAFFAGLAVADVKIRGRWKSEESVRRYQKPHLRAKYLAIMPKGTLQRGREFWVRPRL